jgi:hypothetical protein
MKAHYFHYVEKLRPIKQSSALLFGSAVEAGIVALVLGKSDAEVVAAFDKAWNFQKINGKLTYLPKCLQLAYAESDFDEELLEQDDLDAITREYGVTEYKEAFKKVYEEKKYFGYDGMPNDRREFLNYINWLCLYRKALHMFPVVKREFLPLIEEVLSVQERIDLPSYDENGKLTGDSITGFIDMVIRLKGYKTPIVFDWKTSSRDYEEESVKMSIQLATYLHAVSDKYEDTRLAGYGVLLKHINKNKTKVCTKCSKDMTGKNHKTCDEMIEGKRCHGELKITLKPEAEIQVIIDEIPEYTEMDVLQNMAAFAELMRNGVFIKNYDACIKPWGKCPYYGKCREGKGNDGLVVVETESSNSLNENVPLTAHSR